MPVGRPPQFEKAEDLQKMIEAYYDQVIIDGRNPTITGLAYYLGFESRQSFYDYEEKEQFTYTIKRARLQIEENYENALFNKNAAGPIFALKNFGWKDTQEIKHDIPKGVFSIDPLADDTTHHGASENSVS